MTSTARWTSPTESSSNDCDAPVTGARTTAAAGTPVVIRKKKHPATPMTIDDALYRMELVGHDFFLFVDAESGNPKVVYRRKGWSYGVIELDGEQKAS